MALGNRHIAYKEALNAIEAQSPGSKASFLLGFLDRMAPLLSASGDAVAPEPCPSCGSPANSDGGPCAFCRLASVSSAHEAVPVRMVLGRAARRAYDEQWGSTTMGIEEV